MASKHEVIKWAVITDWSLQRKGRLYCMTQGLAYPVTRDDKGNTVPAEFPLWFGPLKRKFKGFPDTFGFEFCDYHYYDNYQYKEIRVPVFTVVEMKTKNDSLRPGQKDYLNYCVSIGGRAYVAREVDSGYELVEWEG